MIAKSRCIKTISKVLVLDLEELSSSFDAIGCCKSYFWIGNCQGIRAIKILLHKLFCQKMLFVNLTATQLSFYLGLFFF